MARKDPYIQALRGLAIAAVVLVHCLPESPVSIAARPLLNWAVALFFFLSGMLTGKRERPREEVFRRRILNVLGPYVVWSLVYLAVSRPGAAGEIAAALLTGGASAQLYYLLVYIQLTALAPLLMKLLRSHRVALYLVTPCVLVVWELRALCGVDAPSIAVLFPVWLIYYLFGLEWERWRVRLQGREGAVVLATCVALALQAGEGFLWNAFGDYNMATTQLRLTNMVSSLAAISLFMLAPERVKSVLAGCRPLVRLGDVSFGVYLCHIAFILVLRKACALIGFAGALPSIALWVLALGCSAAAVVLCRRILPPKVRALIGM